MSVVEPLECNFSFVNRDQPGKNMKSLIDSHGTNKRFCGDQNWTIAEKPDTNLLIFLKFAAGDERNSRLNDFCKRFMERFPPRNRSLLHSGVSGSGNANSG